MDQSNSSSYLSELLESQQRIISKIALGADLPDCLNAICLEIELLFKTTEAKASILLRHENTLRLGAAPSIPVPYSEAINGASIGPTAGSCGTATYLKKQIIVSDIEHDPLWADYKMYALPHDLRACWSNPIFSSSQEVLGSFAVYYNCIKRPEPWHLELIDRFTHLSSLAIERHQTLSREKQLTTHLQQSNKKLFALTSVMPDLAFVLDEDGQYVDIYGGDPSLLYVSESHFIGKNISEIIPGEIAQDIMRVIHQALQTLAVQVFEYQLNVIKGPRVFEARVVSVDQYQPSQPKKRHVLWMARDITDQKRAKEEIEQLAFYDPLTKLPNRRLLLEQLQLVINKTRRHKSFGVLLYMDLDEFKRINDTLGHSIGDQLLVEVSHRIKPLLRTSDLFARIGGDELVILLDAISHDVDHLCEEATKVAKKLIEAFKDPFKLNGGECRVGASIGVSIIQRQDTTADEVLKRADAAMYQSKKSGGNTFTFFDPALQKILSHRMELEQGILQAIHSQQITAHYQPQVNEHGKATGAEALIRWNHPSKGLISPLEFIPIAEQFGLIASLQNIVLHAACRLLQRLLKEQLITDSFRLAINISPVQFQDPAFGLSFRNTVTEYQLSTQRFTLEITEGVLIKDIDRAVAHIKALQTEGFAISVDDFGVGYSSLTYLQNLPINELKIDKSFIAKIGTTETSMAIIDAIITLCQQLRFSVVAEGVEQASQAEALVKRGVKILQGYHFARPMPEDELIIWLKNQQ